MESAGMGDAGERQDRRETERRQAPRREQDRTLRRRNALIATAWAVTGALIVLYLFFVAIGGVKPSEARGFTIAVLVLAVLWIAHAWRRLLAGGHVDQQSRERRGF